MSSERGAGDPLIRAGAPQPAGVALEPPSAWSPFGHPTFRVLWIATVVANVGTWIHDVGAAWLMLSLDPSPVMVSLVQTAVTLPMLMLALPAGALADVLDRRRVLLVAQIWMASVALALGIVTLLGGATPWGLLGLTFLLGIGASLTAPAWQSIVPELVPRPELPAAVTLNSAGFNLARAVGPALGGVAVASAGPAAAFLLNAISFAGVVGGLTWWRRAPIVSPLPAERLASALRVGVRYVSNNPRLIAVLIRTASFILSGSALWALLPLVARDGLGVGAMGYGVLLGAIGAGALTATAFLARLRGRHSADQIVFVATIVYALVLFVAAAAHSFAALLGILLLGGAAWLALLATFQTGAQLTVPSWVRGRALAVYLMTFFGGQAAGALIWGMLAQSLGIPSALRLASAGLILSLAAGLRFRLGTFEKLDLSPSRHWPVHDPSVVGEQDQERSPVLIVTEYQIDPARAAQFGASMLELRRARLRAGAARWELFRDLGAPGRYLEQFVVASWREHLRQQERVTVMDRGIQEAARAFHLGDSPPEVTHFIADRGDGPRAVEEDRP